MIGVYISVKSDKYNITIPLERRITYLRGDSGVGKTTFVDYVLAGVMDGDPNVEVSYPDDYSIDILSSLHIAADIRNRNNAILIIDDSTQSENADFSNTVANVLLRNNLYLLIINRVDMVDAGITEAGKSKCDYAVGSILWVEKDGVNHKVSRFIDKLDYNSYRNAEYDNSLVLSEDKYGMTEFCLKTNNGNIEVDTTENKSKDNIIKILFEYLSKQNHDAVYLYADMAAFGKYFWIVYSLGEIYQTKIILDGNYESFEYMILRTNRFKNLFEIKDEINNMFSWEQYFEKELTRLSGMILQHKYVHGKELPKCMLLPCNNCDEEKYCSKSFDSLEDLLNTWFKDTEFEYLINLLGR